MFAFVRKHAVKIGLAVGALVVAAFGAAYFFPAQTAAALASVVNLAKGAANWVGSLFKRSPGSSGDVPSTEVPQMPVESVPSAA